jgi:hypothetical protein
MKISMNVGVRMTLYDYDELKMTVKQVSYKTKRETFICIKQILPFNCSTYAIIYVKFDFRNYHCELHYHLRPAFLKFSPNCP